MLHSGISMASFFTIKETLQLLKTIFVLRQHLSCLYHMMCCSAGSSQEQRLQQVAGHVVGRRHYIR